MKRIYAAVATAVATLALSACGSSGSSANGGSPAPTFNTQTAGQSTVPAGGLPSKPGSVTIGSAQFDESELLADIYGDAMAAKGVKVTKHLKIGERPVYMAAMKDGSISAFPEYSGSILAYFDPKTTAKTPDDVYAALQKTAASQGFVVTKFA